MPRQLTEITATITSQRHRFQNPTGDVVVLSATVGNGDGEHEPATLIGAVEDDGHGNEEPASRLAYRFYGSWQTHQRYGRQFAWKTFVRATPHTRAGCVKYLQRAPNIGKAFAAKLFDKFHGDCVRILREQPDVASAACPRLTESAAREAAAWLEREKSIEDCMIELIGLLDGRGFPKGVAKEAVKDFGNQAAALIKRSPYLLMRYRGCGFKRADALYLELGLPPKAIKRQALCAWHAAASDSSGDTWHYEGTVQHGLNQSIGGAEVNYEKAMRLATRAGALERVWTDGACGPPSWDGDYQWVAEAAKAKAERRLAEFIVEGMRE